MSDDPRHCNRPRFEALDVVDAEIGNGAFEQAEFYLFVIMTPAIRAIDEKNCNSKNEE